MNSAILRLLIALARLALEHDKGYASRKVYDGVSAAIRKAEDELRGPT